MCESITRLETKGSSETKTVIELGVREPALFRFWLGLFMTEWIEFLLLFNALLSVDFFSLENFDPFSHSKPWVKENQQMTWLRTMQGCRSTAWQMRSEQSPCSLRYYFSSNRLIIHMNDSSVYSSRFILTTLPPILSAVSYRKWNLFCSLSRLLSLLVI